MRSRVRKEDTENEVRGSGSALTNKEIRPEAAPGCRQSRDQTAVGRKNLPVGQNTFKPEPSQDGKAQGRQPGTPEQQDIDVVLLAAPQGRPRVLHHLDEREPRARQGDAPKQRRRLADRVVGEIPLSTRRGAESTTDRRCRGHWRGAERALVHPLC